MLKEKLTIETVPSAFVQLHNDTNLQFHCFNTIFDDDDDEILTPELLASTIITTNLKFQCFVLGKPVPCSSFKDFASTRIITRMSSLLNILALQKSMVDKTSKSNTSSKLPASLEIAVHYLNQYADQSWAFKKHTVKRKRKFRNQNFSTVKRKRKFRNQKFLRSKRKRKFRNQNFLRVKCKRKFRNQNYFSLKRKRKFRNQNF